MRKIEAIIRPERVSEVKNALEQLGYPGMTLTDVKGHGKQKGLVQQWRGRPYRIEFLPKVKIELVVENGDSGPSRTSSEYARASGERRPFERNVAEMDSQPPACSWVAATMSQRGNAP